MGDARASDQQQQQQQQPLGLTGVHLKIERVAAIKVDAGVG